MQFAIALFDGFAALDAVGPYQVFVSLPDADVAICAETPGLVADESGTLAVEATRGLDALRAPDVVLVPGGMGTRRLARNGGALVDWIRSTHEHARVTASVCTGSLLLGKAGLLAGRRATTHWMAYDYLRAFGATPSDDRVVFDDRIATAAGVSAGLDLALALVGKLAGDATAQAVQLGIEYDPSPPYDAGSPSKAPVGVRDLVASLWRAADAAATAEAAGVA